MSQTISDTDILFGTALKTVQSVDLPQQVEGHIYNETANDLYNQAVVYTAMVTEDKLTRQEIKGLVEIIFGKPLKGAVPVVTLIDLINKGLVKVTKPDDSEASDRQRKERYFLYAIA